MSMIVIIIMKMVMIVTMIIISIIYKGLQGAVHLQSKLTKISMHNDIIIYNDIVKTCTSVN